MQLARSIEAVFQSWNTPRARTTAGSTTSPTTWAPRSTCVQMVFGNMGDDSATGVAFTRNPSTGRARAVRRVPAKRAGRGRGGRHPHAAADGRAGARAAARASGSWPSTMQLLERHYREMQDIEFTIERGTLYLLQTRTGKRTAAAALKIAAGSGGRGADLARRGAGADRSRPARPAAAPDHRPVRGARRDRPRSQRVAGRGRRRGRLRRGHGGGARQGRTGRDPGARRDDARRHPRHGRSAGHPDRPRRHDVARGGRRARAGQAVRGRCRGDRCRRRGAAVPCGRRRGARGRRDHDRRQRAAR